MLLEQSPDTVAGTDFAALIVSVVDYQLGETTDDAAHTLGRWGMDDTLAPAVRELAGRVFAHRAFDDREWIARADSARRAHFEYCDRTPELVADAEQLLGGLRAHAHTIRGHASAAIEALRILDAILRADLVGARGADLAFEILELGVVPVLCDSSVGPAVAAEVGRLGETTCVDYLQPAVVTHPDFLARSLGQRLDKSVFDWLASSMKQQPTFDEFAADRSAVTSPVCVLVAEASSSSPRTVDERPANWRQLRCGGRFRR